MTFDWVLILAPTLLLPIVALLRFVGCQVIFPLHESDSVDSNAVNCGGPSITDAGITFQKDDIPLGTEINNFKSEGGDVFKLPNTIVTDGNGNPASEVYSTCRVGADLKYTFSALVPGGFVVTLKFAEIAGEQTPGKRIFEVLLNGESSGLYDIVARAGASLIAHDEDFLAKSVDRKIAVDLHGLNGTQALVSAIQIRQRNAVAISPTQLVIFAGASQSFEATANFDNAQFEWDLIQGSHPGQIVANGALSAYTAPGDIVVPTRETVTVEAAAGNSLASASASVFIYLPIETATKGKWKGVYGIEGFVLANADTSLDRSLPFYVKDFVVRLTDATALDVADLGIAANDPRVLTAPNGDPRPALVWDDLNGAHGITISFTFLDSDPHLFGIYCLDNGPDRRQRFTVTQLDSSTIQTVDSAIGTGTYLFWIGKGRIQIDITKVPGSAGVNNVVNAVFFR